MRQKPLALIFIGLFAVSAAAAAKTVPELLPLDQELSDAQSAREAGLLAPERYAEFLVRFRVELAESKAAAAPSPADDALYARILARLGEFEKADAFLGEALKKNYENPALHAVLSQVRYDEKDYPAALAEANAALKFDPTDKEALVLKHFSAGRVAMNVRAGGDRAFSPPPARRYPFAAADPATLPFKLPIKVSPAAAPPGIAAGDAPSSPGPLPLLPLAEAAALGLAAYEVSRARTAYESDDGLDDDHPQPAGRRQRLVAGVILAGAAGAALYAFSAAAVSAAPVAIAYAATFAAPAEEAAPQSEAAADAEPVIIRKGEILNRVWHSAWTKGSELSGPNGYSYCRGACLPIHAARAIEGRGLDAGVINDAGVGGLYRATEDVAAFMRPSIGGYDEEILFRSPEDMQKLELIPEHVSRIPPGK